MSKIIAKYWRKLKSLFRKRKLKSPQAPQEEASNRWSRQQERHIVNQGHSNEQISASGKISRSSMGTAVQSASYEEIHTQSYLSPPAQYVSSSSYRTSMQAEEINIGSGFELNSSGNYMPSIVREEDVPMSIYSSGESYNRSMSRSLGRKKTGQTLVQELERKKSIKRAALEPVRNPNVTTLVDVTPPNLIKKGTLLDNSCVSLSRSKSRSRSSLKLMTDHSSEGLSRSKSKSRRSKPDSSGITDSGLQYASASGYQSGNSNNSNRGAPHLNNTSDDSEDRSFELQRKFLSSTDGLQRQKTQSSSNNEKSANLSRRKSRRTIKELSPDEVQQVSRTKSVRRHPSLADARVDTNNGLSRSRSIRNQESLSRRKSKKRIVNSSDDDDVPLGLTIRR